MAASNYYGFGNDGHSGSHTGPSYSHPPPAHNFPVQQQSSAYFGDMKYQNASPYTQPAAPRGYGNRQNYMESDTSFGAREENQSQHSMHDQGYQETYYDHSSSSHPGKPFYQDQEPEYPVSDTYVEDNKQGRKGSWNTPSDLSTEPAASYHPVQQNRYEYGSRGSGDSRYNGSGLSYTRKDQYPYKQLKSKGPPRPPQLLYCEICKISCAGSQTYKEHLEGQKHKKKEGALSSASSSQPNLKAVQTPFHCNLCVISCTGADAYAAHIKGVKHQKVVKLHTKLGKPIPPVVPAGVNSDPTSSSATTTKPPSSTVASPPQKSTDWETTSARSPQLTTNVTQDNASLSSALVTEADQEDSQDGLSESQPVGQNFVEEVRNEDGKTVRFQCKLCECTFNDLNAKEMHLKGRRHRLQYKKKVNPHLPVDLKPSNRPRKLLEERPRRHRDQRKAMQRQWKDEHFLWCMEMRRYEEDMYLRQLEEEYMFWRYEHERRMHYWESMHLRGRTGGPQPLMPSLSPQRRGTIEDHYIMRKHSQIYPSEKELKAVQKSVSLSERALKLVSDKLREENGDKDSSKGNTSLLLKGVVRVGHLSKGLLLRGDTDIHLTLLCAEKPNHVLMEKVAELLPVQLETLTKEKPNVTHDMDEAHFIITFQGDPTIKVTVSLTSHALGIKDDENDEGTPSEETTLLNMDKCTKSLSRLRQAKWFQAHADGLQSCVLTIRILRDLCQRVSTWTALSDWALEVLVEKVLSSASLPLSPGDAVRRVLECVASGVLLLDGPGLKDPCEKESCDMFESLTKQEREDITTSAQHAVRLITFRKIHKVLGMEPIRTGRNKANVQNKKRQLDSTDKAVEGEEKKVKTEDAQNV
ncbi:zinc finger RNA-binding protein 2 isoform X2 [Pseudophryne corroboree]|uniref:zinc finger RNA-binding protein 2 isoform X2 n=1 Tax=Pseudophryne corroboree TaxID=495146 RepID=UPI0030817E7E